MYFFHLLPEDVAAAMCDGSSQRGLGKFQKQYFW